ncbi:MAG TPA: zf-HC2 domain-containing protein [Fimbriimonas sp.]|nr:zf-HC2 domain-containing protein [Fimbriimonas sp.]
MIDLNLLHAYADGELSDAEMRAVEEKLAACKASQAELAAIQNLKGHLLSTPSTTCADTWKACQSRLDGLDRVKKSENFVTRYSWLMVSAVAMFVLAGGYVSRVSQAGSVDSGAFAGVFSNSRSVSPENQFRNAQLDAILKHADRQLQRVRIVGQSATEVNGQVVPRFELVDSVGTMFLIALPPVTGFESMEKTSGNYYRSSIDGDKNIVAWKTADGAMILMGKRSHKALEESARINLVPPVK